MDDSAKEADRAARLPDAVLYHGTSRRRWSEASDLPQALYASTDPEEAASYAYERAACDEEEGHAPEPIVVAISPAVLAEIAAASESLSIEPDWGWVTGAEAEARHRGQAFPDPSWEASVAACGCLCISGFEDRFKELLETASPVSGAVPSA